MHLYTDRCDSSGLRLNAFEDRRRKLAGDRRFPALRFCVKAAREDDGCRRCHPVSPSPPSQPLTRLPLSLFSSGGRQLGSRTCVVSKEREVVETGLSCRPRGGGWSRRPFSSPGTKHFRTGKPETPSEEGFPASGVRYSACGRRTSSSPKEGGQTAKSRVSQTADFGCSLQLGRRGRSSSRSELGGGGRGFLRGRRGQPCALVETRFQDCHLLFQSTGVR